MKKTTAISIAILAFIVILAACVGNETVNENNTSTESQVAGGAQIFSYRAKVIEIGSEHSLIVEILPKILQGEEYSWTEREGECNLVVGDIVKAVYKSDNDRAAEFITRINTDDIVNISYFNRANLSFDFSTKPIIVDCDGISIYDPDGRDIIEDF